MENVRHHPETHVLSRSSTHSPLPSDFRLPSPHPPFPKPDIALEGLESTYKGTNVLSNLCVYANGECTNPIGIATLHESNLRHFLRSQTLSGVDADKDSLDSLAKNSKVVDAVLKEVNGVGKKGGFKGAEVLGGMVLDAEEWTPENGLVTAAQKVRGDITSLQSR